MELEVLALVVGACLLLVLMRAVSRKTSGLDHAHFKKKWSEIEKTLATEEVGPRLAVIEADKLLDQALKQLRFSGETMGDRLRNAEVSIKNYQSVWEAHKLRNRLVHEDVTLKKPQAKAAVSTVRTALKSLGAL